jgi:hypothetical protein
MLEKIFYGTGFGRERMSAARAGYLFLVWVLVPGWLVMSFATMLVGMAFTGAFSGLSQRMNADISFRRPFFTWTGDVGFEELSVRPLQPDPERPMSMQVHRVRFDLPNLGVMQSVLTAAGADDDSEQAGMLRVINQLDHIGVEVQGMKFDSFTGLPGVLEQVGAATAAPMEAEGCVGDVMWVASELPTLGIANEGIDLQLTLANAKEEHEVRVTGELVSPHSSRATFAQHFRSPTLAEFLDAPDGSRIATYERVAIEDDGFIAARDGYCAKRDGVAPEEFRERHLAAVRRHFEAAGMRPSQELEAVYRDYLQHGKLVLEARPNARVHRTDYHQYSVEDQAKMYNGTLAAGGKPVPVRFEEVPSRAIPLVFEGSTWDLVAVERARAAGAAGSGGAGSRPQPAPASPLAPAVLAATTPTPAAVAPALRQAAVPAAATVAAAAAPAAAKPAASKPAAKATSVPAWAMPAPSIRTTSDGRPLASSLPAKGNQARTGPHPLSFEELRQHMGDRIVLITIYGNRVEGRVEAVSGQTLRLRVSAGLGYAITNFEHAKIRSITAL